jgi:hypothetical protein
MRCLQMGDGLNEPAQHPPPHTSTLKVCFETAHAVCVLLPSRDVTTASNKPLKAPIHHTCIAEALRCCSPREGCAKGYTSWQLLPSVMPHLLPGSGRSTHQNRKRARDACQWSGLTHHTSCRLPHSRAVRQKHCSPDNT